MQSTHAVHTFYMVTNRTKTATQLLTLTLTMHPHMGWRCQPDSTVMSCACVVCLCKSTDSFLKCHVCLISIQMGGTMVTVKWDHRGGTTTSDSSLT